MSPTMTTFKPLTEPKRRRREYESNKACVGCSCVPSPALTIWAGTFFERNTQAPGSGCRITTISTFIERMLFTVSMSVSPFETDETDAEKLTTSAERRFSANSNEVRVRVLFSKNRLAMVVPLSEGTFLMGRDNTSEKVSAVRRISSMSFLLRYLIPNRWSTLRLSIDLLRFFAGLAG